jgi:hypothetical protein
MPAAAKPKNLAEALFRVQGEVLKVQKDGKNPHFNSTFASLPGIMEVLNPVLQKNDLFLAQVMDCSERGESGPGLRTVLFHVPTQEKIEGLALFPAGLNAQQTGGAVTYFRRYGILSMLGIVADEDDDGSVASTPVTTQRAVSSGDEDLGQTQPPTGDVLPAASGSGLGGGVVL